MNKLPNSFPECDFDIELGCKLIHVNYENGQKLFLKKSDLYIWLRDNDRIGWIDDSYSALESDGHKQLSGSFGEIEYFEYQPEEAIKEDLKLYFSSLNKQV